MMKPNNYFNSFFNIVNMFSRRQYVPPVTTVSGTDVNLGQGLSYTVKASGLSVYGNQGYESVIISPNVSGIKIDSTVESVTLTNLSYNPAQIVSSKGSLVINSSTGSPIATLSVAANHSESLTFANATGTLSLDSIGNALFNLTAIQLDKNQSYTASVNNLQILGSSGTEKVTLDANVAGVKISSTVENVSFLGNSSDYNYTVQNNGVNVSNKNTGKAIAFINVNSAATGTQIQFTDKTLTATWDETVTWNSKGWAVQTWQISVTDPTAPATPTSISGGTNLQYSVDFSKANLGSYLANVQASVKTALENLGQYISSKSVFNLEVLTENTTPKTLAEATATMVSTTGTNGVTQTTSFLAEAAAGNNLNGSTPDATIFINLANMNQLSFSGSPAPNKYDLTSILTHEILHGIAFTGNLDANATGAKTPYDALVTLQNNQPVFTGKYAQAANANKPIPLISASAGDGSAYYHVAVANDLMSDSLSKGQVRNVSTLDIAMLQDMGVTIVGVSPVQTVA
jgi:hypothetical protein